MFKPKYGLRIFGVVFGPGTVTSVWENSHFAFEVTFDTGDIVAYLPDGIPSWNTNLEQRTVYEAGEIDITTLEMSPLEKVLSPKKIIKLRLNGKLEVRCPSGVWRNIYECPRQVTEEYLGNGLYHLFRKGKI